MPAIRQRTSAPEASLNYNPGFVVPSNPADGLEFILSQASESSLPPSITTSDPPRPLDGAQLPFNPSPNQDRPDRRPIHNSENAPVLGGSDDGSATQLRSGPNVKDRIPASAACLTW